MSRFTALFPLWALFGVLLALWQPDWVSQGKGAILPLLGVVMFGMGVTLRWDNFQAVWRRPRVVLFGSLMQYAVMPLAAWSIGLLLALPPELLAGLVLVGACPGGTASNVVCYLARGDLALSITLTTVSTLLAVVATPLLTWLYLGQRIDVPVTSMLLSIVQVVLLPVTLGILVNRFLGRWLHGIKQLAPVVSVASIVIIVAIIVALNQPRLAELAALLGLAVVLHNGAGLAAGYGLARLLGEDERVARTLAIEVGMQNSGLGVALALQYFGAAAALPGALFSVWHNLSGSLLAAWWRRRGS
jgi:BASS family bile acid:Na+ symporter